MMVENILWLIYLTNDGVLTTHLKATRRKELIILNYGKDEHELVPLSNCLATPTGGLRAATINKIPILLPLDPSAAGLVLSILPSQQQQQKNRTPGTPKESRWKAVLFLDIW
ncbi:hypothetical protein TNCV_3342881 [Trichonephila clavipes]|nr:hypothetical protein TNCV_3342881 [Trichonephila clavipes]